MAKKEKHIDNNDDVRFTIEEAVETADEQTVASHDNDTKKQLSKKLKQKINQTSEADEAPSASLRLRDVLGGDFLWTVVRRQIWLIILIVGIVTAYVAMRYQCQQDAIDIAQLENDLKNAQFESLSSSSNLTEMSRQSNMPKVMPNGDSIRLYRPNQAPFIVFVPVEQ